MLLKKSGILRKAETECRVQGPDQGGAGDDGRDRAVLRARGQASGARRRQHPYPQGGAIGDGLAAVEGSASAPLLRRGLRLRHAAGACPGLPRLGRHTVPWRFS